MNISNALIKTSKEKPLGSSNQSKAGLIRTDRQHLVGYYIVHIKV